MIAFPDSLVFINAHGFVQRISSKASSDNGAAAHAISGGRSGRSEQTSLRGAPKK